MLLNWLFFWDWDGAPPASLTPVAVVIPFGGSGARNDTSYHPLPDEFWEVREKQLAEYAPPDLPAAGSKSTIPVFLPPGPDPAALLLDQLTAERAQLAAAIPEAPSVPDLKQMVSQLREYDAAISEVQGMLRKPS